MRCVSSFLRHPLWWIGSHKDLALPDPHHTFPRNSAAVLPGSQPLDETAGATGHSDDSPALGMDFVHSAKFLPVERFDRRIPQIRQSHYSAPQRGIQVLARFSTT